MDCVHDRRVERDDVAVGEGEDRVKVHRRSELGHTRDDDPLGGTLREQGRGDLGDRLPRGALAHAHQDSAVADRHDVAALEGGLAPVLFRVAPPDRGADEVGMEGVDRLVDRVSSCRAGQYSGFNVRPPYSQQVVSRVYRVFGSGGMRYSRAPVCSRASAT